MAESENPLPDDHPLAVGWAAYAPLTGAVLNAHGESVLTPEQFAVLQRDGLPALDLAVLSARPVGTPDEEAPPPVGTPVWFTRWQVDEARLDVGVGDEVDWRLTPMDLPWLTRLFGARRTVDLQLDFYAEALGDEQEYSSVAGAVVGVEVVRCPMHLSTDPSEGVGWVPVPGQAWTTRLDRTRDLPDTNAENVYGFIVHVRED